MKNETLIKQKSSNGINAGVRRNAIINFTKEDRLKRSDKLWKRLVKELDLLQDDNYTARKLFDYIERHYA